MGCGRMSRPRDATELVGDVCSIEEAVRALLGSGAVAPICGCARQGRDISGDGGSCGGGDKVAAAAANWADVGRTHLASLAH